MTPRRRESGTRRAVKRTLLVVGMVFVIIYLVIPQITSGWRQADLIANLNPFLLVLAVVLEGTALVAYSVLSRVTLPPQPHLPLFTILRIQLSTRAVTNLVPGGSAAGSTLGYRLYTDAGVPPTAAGFTLATVGLGSAVVLNLILWLALLVSIPLNGFRPAYVTAALVGVLLLASAGALVYLLMEGRHTAERVLRAIARRIPFVEEDTASRFVHQLADRLHDLAGQPELVRRGALWAAAFWFLYAAALWVFLRAFGESVSPINLIVAYGVASVLAAIPITPGGLGVVETALPALLVSFGTPAAHAGVAVLGWRFVQFWLPIPLGGLSFASLKLGNGLDRQKRFGSVRAIADQATQMAQRRVWDSEIGQFRPIEPDDAEQSSDPDETGGLRRAAEAAGEARSTPDSPPPRQADERDDLSA